MSSKETFEKKFARVAYHNQQISVPIELVWIKTHFIIKDGCEEGSMLEDVDVGWIPNIAHVCSHTTARKCIHLSHSERRRPVQYGCR